MSVTNSGELQRIFVSRFDDLRRWLTRRLGSEELANDALQEAYLRLGRADEMLEVRNPVAYLFRIACNIATDHRRTYNRRATVAEIDEILDVADDSPGPLQIAESRLRMRELEKALMALTPRRREILIAARVDNVPTSEIAARLDISVRTVQMELRRAILECSNYVDGK